MRAGGGPGGDVVAGAGGARRWAAAGGGQTPSRARQRRGCRLPRAGVEAGAVGRVPRRSTARLCSVFLQVPSAFRRGGLKTPGGSPVRLGSGADGPVGSRAAWPSSPRSPSPPGGAAVAFAPRAPAATPGGGEPPRPASVVGSWARAAAAPRLPGRPETPGRLWGSRARPRGGGARAHPVFCPPDPSQSGVVVCRRPAGGHPLRGENAPCRPQKKTKNRTTLSGGSLGSCVDEERS